MIIYQDDNGKFVAKHNRRVSGGHKTAAAAMAAIISAEIYALGYDDGEQYTPPAVSVVQAWAADFVNTYAGELRTKIGTDIPFQGDVYQLKEVEAKAFATDNTPNATKYPVLYAEATARQMLPADLAAEYLYNAQAWPVLLGQIESMRMGAITAISAATSVDDIEAVLGGLE